MSATATTRQGGRPAPPSPTAREHSGRGGPAPRGRLLAQPASGSCQQGGRAALRGAALLALCALAALPACRATPLERFVANEAAQTSVLDGDLTLLAYPGSPVRVEGEALVLRSNGTQLQLCVSNDGAADRSLTLLIENLPASVRVDCSLARQAEQTALQAGPPLGEPGLGEVLLRADSLASDPRCDPAGSLTGTASSGRSELSVVVPAGTSCADRFSSAATISVGFPDALSAGPIAFGVVGELHSERELLYQVAEESLARGLEFLVLLGGLGDGADPRSDLRRAANIVRTLGLPVYATLGTLDVDDGGDRVFRELYGPSDSAFVHRQVRFVLLDSADATLANDQHEWLDEVLGHQALASIVFTHVPPFDPADLRDRAFVSHREASRLVGTLARHGVDALFASRFPGYTRSSAAGIPVHITRAASETEEGSSRPHFLVVELDSAVVPPTLEVERVDL